jgi:hypothetical protein
MALRRYWFALVALLGVNWLGGNGAKAALTFVNATSSNTSLASGPGTWSMTGDVDLSDTLWWIRGGQGIGNQEVLVASNTAGTSENAVEIKTTHTGLANGDYNVYVVYETQGTNNWSVRAGFSSNPGANQIFDTTEAADITGAQIGTLASSLSWVGGEPLSNSEVVWAGLIGQYNVTDGTMTVFIDDLHRGTLGGTNSRTWYDGLAFESLDIPTIDSFASGLHTSGGTWTDSLPPTPDKKYRVVANHTVTIDSADFAGESLTVASGGTVDFSASGTYVANLKVEAGGNLSESVSGPFYLGDINAPSLGALTLDTDVTFNIDTEFGLDMALVGVGNLNFNAGSNSILYISAATNHEGIIRFNGTSGGEVQLLENQGFHFLEMNSPGAKLVYDPQGPLDNQAEKVTFNEPGTIVHDSVDERLQGAATIVLNADVMLDLTEAPGSLEKRFLNSANLQGTGNFTINGTAAAPSGTDYNEYELGSQGSTENEPANLATSPISGAITLNGFVNAEIRQNVPNANFVVNSGGLLEMGHMIREATKSIEIGAIQVNSGGVLEIGMEKSFGATDGHFAYHLTLVDTGGESGGLDLNGGAQLNMQINGEPDQLSLFDRITAAGPVELDGTLKLYVNPAVCIGGNNCNGGTAYATSYTPQAGDIWDLITTALDSPLGDYNSDGVVDVDDHAEFVKYFGTNNSDADGNGDGVVDAADYVVWAKNIGQTGSGGSMLTGDFDSIIDDLPGFHFERVNNGAGKFSVILVAGDLPGAGGGAVPEPTTLALAGMMLAFVSLIRRSRK